MSLGGLTGDGMRGRVVVADDNDQNRELFRRILESAGHSVACASNGDEALDVIRGELPDVVLLDVVMPKKTGIDVCRELKADVSTAMIPVLLVTGLTDRQSKIRGIEAGANDYLAKPVDRQDVLLRVRNAIGAKRLYDDVQRSYDRLKELETLRDNLVHMIVHDLRSPLTVVRGSLEFLEGTIATMPEEAQVSDATKRMVATGLRSTLSLLDMINAVLDVSKLEAGQMPLNKEPCDIATIIVESFESLGALAGRVHLVFDQPSSPITVPCDQHLVSRVVVNLLTNAIRFSPSDSTIRVEAEKADETVRVAVTDEGPGVAPEHHDLIFEKFGQVEAGREDKMRSSGLGLAFCKMAVEAHGGTVGIESASSRGSTFFFTLPGIT